MTCSGNISTPSTARGMNSNALLSGFGNGGDVMPPMTRGPSGLGPGTDFFDSYTPLILSPL